MISKNRDGSYTIVDDDVPGRVLEIAADKPDAEITQLIKDFLGPPKPVPPTLEDKLASLEARVAKLEARP